MELAIASGKLGLGTMWLIDRRMWILRRMARVCRVKGFSVPFEVFSMLGEFELLKQKLIGMLAERVSAE